MTGVKFGVEALSLKRNSKTREFRRGRTVTFPSFGDTCPAIRKYLLFETLTEALEARKSPDGPLFEPELFATSKNAFSSSPIHR